MKTLLFWLLLVASAFSQSAVNIIYSNGGTPTAVSSSAPLPVSSSANASTTAATPTQGTKAVASAGTPIVLTGSSATLVDSVEIHARKNATTANTGNVYVGFSASGGSNYRVLVPGETWSLVAPSGKKIDLHLIFVDAATTADAVTWTALN